MALRPFVISSSNAKNALASLFKWTLYSQEHLKTTVASKNEEKEDIKLAPSAVKKLMELQTESPGNLLRVTVEGGGCSGFQYRFSLDDQRQSDDDILVEQEGAKLLCDRISLDFLKGSTVEFVDSLMKSAFQVTNNPNSEASCGCGTSFAVKM